MRFVKLVLIFAALLLHSNKILRCYPYVKKVSWQYPFECVRMVDDLRLDG